MSLLSRIAAAARTALRRRAAQRRAGTSRSEQIIRPIVESTTTAPRRPPGLAALADAARRAPPPLTPTELMAQLEKVARGQPLSQAEAEQLDEQLPPAYREQPPPPPPGGIPPIGAEEEPEEESIEILGRDLGYHEEDFAELVGGQVFVQSSNVYAYYYQPETRFHGILYVTFLAPAPKGQPRTAPGPTYAYYSVSRAKYSRFRADADDSAGGAVWDHLRVRGTLWDHQHPYRLLHVSGEYVPRRATARGFRTRYVRPIGTPRQVSGRLPAEPAARARELRRRGFRRSTLPEQLFEAGPDRGNPDRGTPNRGR